MNDSDEDIVELKRVLRDDESGDATQALIMSLRSAATPISSAMRGAMSRKDYAQAEELLQALQTAEYVLKTVWEKAHPSRVLC